MVKRRIFQIFSTIISNGYFPAIFKNSIYQGLLKGICHPGLNCYACPLAFASCPIGTLQHFVAIRSFPFYLLGFLGTIGATVGRMSCGWVCPFGFLQELLYKIKVPKITLPHFFSYVKYLTLIILVLLVPFLSGEPWFSKLCPAGTLEGGIFLYLWNPETGPLSGLRPLFGVLFEWKLVILGVFLLLMLFIKRPFCRTACPLGAIYSLFNKVSILRLEIDLSRCDRCNVCQKICPMDIKIYESPNDLECIRCLQCLKKCRFIRKRFF
ncbi:MAG: 4Fe-4S binding protein [Candidatus Edwardsbacteria bacterium]